MTIMRYPHVCQEEGSLKVEFGPEMPGANRQPLWMVLDFGSSGEVVGVEVIKLVFDTGKRALEIVSQTVPTAGDGPRYAYDEESDCFALHLKPGPSLDQKGVDGSAVCDEKGRITALNATWEVSP